MYYMYFQETTFFYFYFRYVRNAYAPSEEVKDYNNENNVRIMYKDFLSYFWMKMYKIIRIMNFKERRINLIRRK